MKQRIKGLHKSDTEGLQKFLHVDNNLPQIDENPRLQPPSTARDSNSFSNPFLKNDLNLTSKVQTSRGHLNPLVVSKYRPEPIFVSNAASGIDNDRKVLYRNIAEVGNCKSSFLVEISKNKKKLFILLTDPTDKSRKIIHESLSIKIGEKLLVDLDGSFEDFIKTFEIRFGKLWIQKFHGNGHDQRKNRSSLPEGRRYYDTFNTYSNTNNLKSINGFEQNQN